MGDADTIAAVATAPGIGGVGVIRVSGERVPEILIKVVGRALTPRLASFVRFVDDAGEPIDEGLAMHFPAPRSYTGEEVLEIHAHGGPVVLGRLLARCLGSGARLAQPGEFTKRAFLNGKMDLAQAEAVADLIAARTDQAARSAARSLGGEFSKQIQSFQTELTQLRVVVEGAIDFPDEGIDFLQDAAVRRRLSALLTLLEGALRAGKIGRAQHEGLCAVLVGPPNSGKSSIINMLCMDEVAIVSPLPGTTRDLVRAAIQIDGVPIEIIDTAGLRVTSDLIEGLGIERTRRAAANADVVVVVSDCSGEGVFDAAILSQLPGHARRLRVHNKIDLVDLPPRTQEEGGATDVWVSALTGAGKDDLRRALVSGFAGDSEYVFAARARHLLALSRCRDCVRSAVGLLDSVELLAEELRGAQHALGEITGDVVADDLLGEIFSKFCIGK